MESVSRVVISTSGRSGPITVEVVGRLTSESFWAACAVLEKLLALGSVPGVMVEVQGVEPVGPASFRRWCRHLAHGPIRSRRGCRGAGSSRGEHRRQPSGRRPFSVKASDSPKPSRPDGEPSSPGDVELQRLAVCAAVRHSDLPLAGLWLHYFSLGGTNGEYELDAYIHGLYLMPVFERDILGQAVNEMIDLIPPAPRASFSNDIG